jgi:hypothetical protein
MQTFPLNVTLKRKEHIQWREFGTDGLLLDPSSGDYFELNEVGLLIWKEIDGLKTVEEIIEEISGYFEVDHQDLIGEITEFLDELTRRDLITLH